MNATHAFGTGLRIVAWSIAGLLVVCLTALSGLFLACSPLPFAWARDVLAIAFVVGVVALFVLLKPRWKALLGFCGLFGLVLLWFALILPSNDRDWQPHVARVVTADVDGDQLTVRNVRNFYYRSVTDFDERWETRSYDLARLNSVELLMSYWGSSRIAHTMLTFGFEDGAYLVLSVGPRPEVGEGYAPIHSFFKAFELVYTFADERDLIALRTNHRGEDVYMFPFTLSRDEQRALLLNVLGRANELAETPEFYRTISDNCTTALIRHLKPIRCSIDLLLNGYIPRLAYERGDMPTDAPLDVVMQRYAISAKARAAGVGPDFSQRIRDGLGSTANDSP
ncbi:MAG: Lnb N-terminal periplasmic domain-containing protein [Planctomycetota bacterium]|jgi:hypothetical protein